MHTLPVMRDDLSLFNGPPNGDGAPTWTILDPARNLFFQLQWPSVEILARWKLGTPDAVALAVSKETTLSITERDVANVAEFLVANQLTTLQTADDTARLQKINEAARTSWLKQALHKYLFFRIPLVRPDGFLDATLSAVNWAFSRNFIYLTGFALLMGLYLAGRQWDVFLSSFVDLFSWRGLVLLGVTYLFVKIIHELGHAYAAKRFGCAVPTMGVAFLVLWPVLYTDTNEAWKLDHRGQRMTIAAAGIVGEFAIAAWATLAWTMLPDGSLKTIMFLLATTTWISSLLINLSPFMRFDGYFLLMDWLDVPNLHNRSFALARWKIREWLFGLGAPAPETFSRKRTAFLVSFALFTWTYRLILFLGIAVLVYHFFIKTVGIVLFVVEIAWFIARPVWAEMKVWIGLRGKIAGKRRWLFTSGILIVLIALFVIPWQGRIALPGLLRADPVVVMYAPFSGIVGGNQIKDKQTVKAGQILVSVNNPDIEYDLGQAKRRVRSLAWQVDKGTISRNFSERRGSLFEDLQRADAEAQGLQEQMERQTIAAPFSGTLIDLSPDLKMGGWVSAGEPLFAVQGKGIPVIDAYVLEGSLHRLAVGAKSVFVPDNPELQPVRATLVDIDRLASRSLDTLSLASVYGGPISVRPVNNGLVPEQAFYRVKLRVEDTSEIPELEMRGVVHINAPAESLIAELWRSAAAVILRESGF